MTTTSAPTTTDRHPATAWRWLQFVWGFGLVLTPFIHPVISLGFCALAVLAYWRAAARSWVIGLVAVVAVIDLLLLG